MNILAYILAMLMVAFSSFLLYFYYEITEFWPRFFIVSYMIVYGALMCWSSRK